MELQLAAAELKNQQAQMQYQRDGDREETKELIKSLQAQTSALSEFVEKQGRYRSISVAR